MDNPARCLGQRLNLALALALVILASICLARPQMNAELNRPTATVTQIISTPNATTTITSDYSKATTTGASQSSAAAVSQPSQTDIAPISFSSQQVPYLLNLPESEAKAGGWNGPVFTGCKDDDKTGYADPQFRINVSAVYTQFDQYGPDAANLDPAFASLQGVLRIVAIATVGNESHAFASATDASGASLGLLSAAGFQTRMLTFDVYDYYTYLCDVLYPTGNDTLNPTVVPPSCQYGPGQVAFGASIPLNSTYEAGTLWTQIRLSDASNPARTLTCIEVQTSVYHSDRWYWRLILWLPVALFIVLFTMTTLASVVTAETAQRMAYKNRAREGGAPTFVRDKLRPMILSALAGREMVRSPSLLRFVTPGCWDILFHLHFLVALAMCHVEWPDFVYPFVRQAAWASLLGNVTIVESAGQSHSLLSTDAALPSGDIGTQMSDPESPLFMNASQPNILLNLGNAPTGIERFAAAIGISSSSFFGTCLTIWLAIVAAVLVVSGVSWVIDASFETKHERERKREALSGEIVLTTIQEQGMLDAHSKQVRPFESPLTPFSTQRILEKGKQLPLVRLRLGYHILALHGNLIRALVLFHLPITIVSVFQFAFASEHSTVSVALSVLSFVVFSFGLPLYIIWCIAKMSRERLYEDANTLLALGPVYHMYAPGSQLFYVVTFIHSLGLGITVGAGQKSGLTQAFVVLTIEVMASLASNLWLPWGDGAMMGPLNFLTSIIRIISAVLLVLLSSTVGFSNQARGWLAYVILLLQGIFFVGALFVVLVKMMEALVRVCWRVRFDERLSGRTAGLGGAIRKIRRRKMKNLRAAAAAATGTTPTTPSTLGPSPTGISRPKIHSRNTSTTSTMLAFDSKHGQSPYSSELTRLGYLEYLDHGHGKRPPSAASELEYFIGGGKNGYGRQGGQSPPVSPNRRYRENDESGPIMAALPALTPTHETASFARLNNGRTPDGRPFSSMSKPLSAPNDLSSQARAPVTVRPQSFPGLSGSYDNSMAQQRQLQQQMARPQRAGGYRQLNQRGSSNEFSSTQAAALAAHQSLIGLGRSDTQGKAGPNKNAAPRFGLFGRAKRANAGDDDSTWSEEEEGVSTWNSQQMAERRVPWMGAVKLKAGLTSFRDAIFGGGNQADGHAPIPNADDAEKAESAEKGFEVVRKPRASTNLPQANLAVVTSPPPTRLSEGRREVTHQQAHGQRSSSPFPQRSSEMRASDFYQSSPASQAHNRPLIDDGRRSPLDFYRTESLGLLGADAQDVMSDHGRTVDDDDEDARRRREDQFWIPPIDLSSSDQQDNHRS